MRRGKFGHRGHVRAVTFVNPVGDVQGRHQPEMPQPGDQKRGRRPTIDIIVGKDRNPFAPAHRPQQPVRRRRHIAKRHRVRQKVAQRRGQEGRRIFRHHPPRHQNPAQGQGQPGYLRHAFGQPVLPRIGTDPATPGQRVFDIQEGRGNNHVPRRAAKARPMQGG